MEGISSSSNQNRSKIEERLEWLDKKLKRSLSLDM